MNHTTQKELAAERGVCDRTIRNWIKDGVVRVVRIGKINRIAENAEKSLANQPNGTPAR